MTIIDVMKRRKQEHRNEEKWSENRAMDLFY